QEGGGELLVEQERELSDAAGLAHVQVGVQAARIGGGALRPAVVKGARVRDVAAGGAEHDATVEGKRGVEVVHQLAVVAERIARVVDGGCSDGGLQSAARAVDHVDAPGGVGRRACREGDASAVPGGSRAPYV